MLLEVSLLGPRHLSHNVHVCAETQLQLLRAAENPSPHQGGLQGTPLEAGAALSQEGIPRGPCQCEGRGPGPQIQAGVSISATVNVVPEESVKTF